MSQLGVPSSRSVNKSVPKNNRKGGERGVRVRVEKAAPEVMAKVWEHLRAATRQRLNATAELKQAGVQVVGPTPMTKEIKMTSDTMRAFLDPNMEYPLYFCYYNSYASSVGGGIQNTITDINGLSNAFHYTSAVNVFDEVFLVGVAVDVLPKNRYSKTTTSSTTLFMVKDDDSTPTISSYDEAASYGKNCIKMNIDDGTYDERMGSKPKWFPRATPHTYLSGWQTSATAGLAFTGAIAFYAANLSNSIAYFDVIATYHVKMRLIVGN